MDRENPYEPSPSGAVVAPTPIRRPKTLRTAWSWVFLANLPVPGLFGLMVTGGGFGTGGLVIATAALFVLGFLACRHTPTLARALLAGGVVVAVVQLSLMPHLYWGLACLEFTDALIQRFNPNDFMESAQSLLGGFLATLFTGGGLMAAASGLGLMLLMFSPNLFAERTAGRDEILFLEPIDGDIRMTPP